MDDPFESVELTQRLVDQALEAEAVGAALIDAASFEAAVETAGALYGSVQEASIEDLASYDGDAQRGVVFPITATVQQLVEMQAELQRQASIDPVFEPYVVLADSMLLVLAVLKSEGAWAAQQALDEAAAASRATQGEQL